MAKKTETKKTETKNEENTANSMLIGYVRRSNAGGALKLSINTSAFADCSTYVPLIISLNALNKVLSGERAVTTVSQFQD